MSYAMGFRRAALVLSAGMAAATPCVGRASTLEEALVKAYDENPQLLAGRAQLRATDETVPEALAGWRPTVQVSAGAGYDQETTSSGASSGAVSVLPSRFGGSTKDWDVQVRQPVYSGRTVAQTEQAEFSVQAGRAQLALIEGTVLYSVAQAYLDCVRDEALLKLAIESEQTLKAELDGIETLTRAGTYTAPDKLLVEAQLASAGAQRTAAEANLSGSREAYRRMVGELPGPLDEPVLHPVLPPDREKAVELAEQSSPAVVAAEFVEKAGDRAIDSAVGQLLPTVSIIADNSRFFDGTSNGVPRGDTVDSSLLAVISVPLYDGGASHAQIRQAEHTHEQLVQQAEDIRRAARQSAAQAWDRLDSLRRQAPDLTHAITAQTDAYRGVSRQQMMGARTVNDVLAAFAQLFSARAALIGARHDSMLGEYELALQCGQLTMAALGVDTPLYDSERHYRDVRDSWFGFGEEENHDRPR